MVRACFWFHRTRGRSPAWAKNSAVAACSPHSAEDPPMESSSRTLVCSVLFLDIVQYSRKPVAEQLQLKQLFNAVLAKALDQVAAADRIILDTGDGAAVTFMGDPEDALFAAMSVRDMASTVPVRLGVNL